MSREYRVSENYIRGIEKIFWGYIFILFNINLGNINILPAWAGYGFLLSSISGISEEEPTAKLLKPFAILLIVYEAVLWGAKIFGMVINAYWLGLIMTAIGLYFHFQLFTNLAQTSDRLNCSYGDTFRGIRNVMTVLLTGTAFFTLLQEQINVITETAGGMIGFLCGIFFIVMAAVIMVSLHGYKKELLEMGELDV